MLDISATSLEKAKERLGPRAKRVHWIAGDVMSVGLAAGHYDLWHDRAVFHFLTDPADRTAYVRAASRAVRNGGFLIAATFAPEAPALCSGLPVERYGPERLEQQFSGFSLIESRREEHQTPSGAMQPFTYILMTRVASNANRSAPLKL